MGILQCHPENVDFFLLKMNNNDTPNFNLTLPRFASSTEEEEQDILDGCNCQNTAQASGGSRISRRGDGPVRVGCGPPTRVLFSENACENEKIGSHRGVCAQHAP